MKKMYKFLIAGTVAAFQMNAQLSGIYTIDDTSPASATNYTSFTALATDLNSNGVSGAVIVNVAAGSGPYIEQVEFTQAPGVSASNSVVINGNGCTLSYNATTTTLRHTLLLSGADHMTFNNLHVEATHNTNGLTCHLWNGANNNNFNDCLFEASMTGTGTFLSPFSISGTSVSASATGNDGGSYNIVSTCTMIGGYYSTVFAGTNANVGNEVHNSVIRDFRLYGFYNLQCLNSVAKGNIVDRLNRTSVSTTYAMYLSTGSTANGLIEGNHIRNLYNGITNNSSATYCIYLNADASQTAPNVVKNNVISDINNNGTNYGIYLSGAAYAYAQHNTISFDSQSSTAGTTYGIYCSGPNSIVRNNIVTISRAGTGTKYCLYYTTAATNLISDHNALNMTSAAGTTGLAYLGQAYNDLPSWQAGTGLDLNSVEADPVYTNPAAQNYIPTSLAVNNIGLPVGILNDYNNTARSPIAPDPGAFETYTAPCSGTPPSNSLTLSSASICPGSGFEIGLASVGIYTNSGYQIQWYSSTISVGGYSAIPGATLPIVSTGAIMNSTYYQAEITCTLNTQTASTPPSSVVVLPGTISNVPYFESFETLAQNDLPNCSWSATNQYDVTFTSLTPQSDNRLPRTGNGYAYFSNSPAGTNYFYSNPITMSAGITYSAALWYVTDNIDFSEWTDLSILVGTSQNPGSMVQVATASPVTGNLYNLLSNTFTVPVNGQYYVAVRATPGAGSAPYLTWDDLSVTIPCSINSPTLSLFTTTNTVCEGNSTNLTAVGADSYLWSSGATGSFVTVSPTVSGIYQVTGLHAASGCTAVAGTSLTVHESPQISAFANFPSICTGQSSTLIAQGADSYFWTNGFSGQSTAVNPLTSTIYSVSGTNSLGCTATATVEVTVNQLPLVTAQASNTMACAGDAIDLQAIGADIYLWTAPDLYSTEVQLTVSPQSSTIYTLSGTDINGCTAISQITIMVEPCTGLAENNQAKSKFMIYPNPATTEITIETISGRKNISVTDITGKTILSKDTESANCRIDIKHLPAGVYYLMVKHEGSNWVEKVIKH